MLLQSTPRSRMVPLIPRLIHDLKIEMKLTHKPMNVMQKLLLAAGLLALPSLVFAHGGATGATKERMDAMAATKDSLNQLRSATSSRPVNDELAMSALNDLQAFSAELPSLFEEKHLPKVSEALPGIWENAEQFDAQIRFFDAQLSLAKSQLDDAPEKVLRTVAAGCASCHDKFREKKQ